MSDGLIKPEKDFTETLDAQLPEILASATVAPPTTHTVGTVHS